MTTQNRQRQNASSSEDAPISRVSFGSKDVPIALGSFVKGRRFSGLAELLIVAYRGTKAASIGGLLQWRRPHTSASKTTPAVEQPDERWLTFVRSLAARNLSTVTVTIATEHLWKKLRSAVPSLVPPNASPTDEKGLSMSWNRGRHYLEIETLPTGAYDWYYRDRDLGVSSGETSQQVEAAPTDALKRILTSIF